MSRKISSYLGPSIIVAAAVVGTGELVVAPRLGAQVGISALWIIVLGCLVKVLLQEELGRHTILTGETTLQAFNRVPGPRWRLSWISWSWLILLVSTSVQQAGILTLVVQTLQLGKLPLPPAWLAVGVMAVTALLLIAGKYLFVERSSALLVAVFTGVTLLGVVLLQRTPDAISWENLLQGFRFDLPPSDGTGLLNSGWADAIAVFGITGIGTAELLFYPYWCLEKGYARDLHQGGSTPGEEVRRRITGMRVDIVVALVIYTFATIAFFLLGARVLNRMGVVPEGFEMIKTLSNMYTEVFGQWMYGFFVLAAFFVLYSTLLVSLGAFARLFTDTLRLAQRPERQAAFPKERFLAGSIIGLAVVYLFLYMGGSRTPQVLVVGGAIVQTLMLPVFGFAIYYLRFKRKDPHRPGLWFDLLLAISLLCITAAAGGFFAIKILQALAG